MAGHFTQTLTKLSISNPKFSPNSLSSRSQSQFRSRFIAFGSNFSSKAQLLEVDLYSSATAADSAAASGGEMEVMGLKRLEDAIHSIIVRRLAPDWLPFRPGAFYWVPLKRNADNILEMVVIINSINTDTLVAVAACLICSS